MFSHSRTKALSSLAWSVAPYHDSEYIEAWKYSKVCRFYFSIVLYTEDTNLLLGLFNPSPFFTGSKIPKSKNGLRKKDNMPYLRIHFWIPKLKVVSDSSFPRGSITEPRAFP
jgi:hypothetical protein